MANRDGRLFRMMFRYENLEKCIVAMSIKKWHEKLAHQNISYVRDILKKNNIKYVDDWDDYVCEGCVYGKHHRLPHPRNFEVAKEVLDVIHVDLCEMNINSFGGAKYFFMLKVDFSHFCTVYFLKTKNETFEKLKITLVENQFRKKIKVLKSDNGKEIKNGDTKKFCEELGVFHIKSNPYTAPQNSRIEREMRTIVESARSAIHARNLNENLWAEAISYATFTLNQTGKSSVTGKSPVDLWFGRRIDVNKLRIFGCDCYVFIQDFKRGKTQKKSEKGIFLGYSLDSSSYRVYLRDKNEVVTSGDVIFDEKVNSKSSCTEIEATLSNEEKEYIVSSEEEKSDCVKCLERDQTVCIQPEKRSLRNRATLRMPARMVDYVVEDNRNKNVNMAMIGEVEDISILQALQDEKTGRKQC